MGILKWLGLDSGEKKEPVELNDENFKLEVTESEIPVLVDIWSPGCAPCMALSPTIMRLAGKYEGKIKVAQLNSHASPKITSRLGVRGTPTVLFFDRGQIVERVVGTKGQHYYEEIIEEDLLRSDEFDNNKAHQGG